MATRAVNHTVGKLYAGLNERERVRMLARLSREHDPAEMSRLRDATPPEHADAYNQAIGLLRALNGNVPDWLAIALLGMERDRLRLRMATVVDAHQSLARSRTEDAWRLTPYPVTESEYRAIVRVARAELVPLNEYVGKFFDVDPETPGLRPELAEITRALPSSDEGESDEAEALWDTLWERFYACFTDAIRRGELPKAKPKPPPAEVEIAGWYAKGDEDEPWLPAGALSDWAIGTTEATFEARSPAFAVPIIGALFEGGTHARWEIRPDEAAADVKARREELREIFLGFTEIFEEARVRAPSLEPPLTLPQLRKARKQATDYAADHLSVHTVAQRAGEAATSHATFRAQLEGFVTAIEIVQRDDFHGEDPLRPHVRSLIEHAQTEALRFAESWAESMTNLPLLKALGPPTEGLPTDTLDKLREPPLPTNPPDTEEMLRLIRDWGERS